MAKLNGSGTRHNKSWIESFVEQTENLESPEIFRQWAAITTIGAVLEQKVWLQTSSPLFPNLYAFIVGHPGVGKTRTIRAAKKYITEIPDFYIAPTSMTSASMVDALISCKRTIIRMPEGPLEYNTMLIAADELGAFMHEYDKQMVDLLSAFYDPDPYGQDRRGKEIKIRIKSPQVSILCGTTPSNLVKLIPEGAWDQGFMSRMILVFSDERIISDDIFSGTDSGLSKDLIIDLKLINSLHGQFSGTEDYRNAINNWRKLGQPPIPSHPKLVHYCTRRLAHLFKLSMVSSVDRDASLLLTKDDFNRAMRWLLQAEALMPEVFKAGAPGADSKAMDEIYHYILVQGKNVIESKIVRFASERIPAHSVMRVLDLMERSGMIRAVANDQKTGLRYYSAVVTMEPR